MPDAHESCKKRPASHTHALGELFIPDELEKVQGGSEKIARRFTKLMPETPRLLASEEPCDLSVRSPLAHLALPNHD